MPELPDIENINPDLDFHRDFIEYIGDLLSGQIAVRIEDSVVRVYRLPSHKMLMHEPEARNVGYGTISWNEQGYFEKNSGRPIQDWGPPHDKMDFLNDIRHRVESKRRDLALESNKKYESMRTSRDAAMPPGELGHLLREYDQLLEQINHEHYRQRNENQQQ